MRMLAAVNFLSFLRFVFFMLHNNTGKTMIANDFIKIGENINVHLDISRIQSLVVFFFWSS